MSRNIGSFGNCINHCRVRTLTDLWERSRQGLCGTVHLLGCLLRCSRGTITPLQAVGMIGGVVRPRPGRKDCGLTKSLKRMWARQAGGSQRSWAGQEWPLEAFGTGIGTNEAQAGLSAFGPVQLVQVHGQDDIIQGHYL
jgi:hypothetical protein